MRVEAAGRGAVRRAGGTGRGRRAGGRASRRREGRAGCAVGRLVRKVGGLFPRVFIWMTVGGRGGWLTGGRCGGTRCDLRGYGVGRPAEQLDGLIGGQRGIGYELLGDPAPTGDLDAPLMHEPFLLQLPLGAGEGVSPDPGTLGGGGEGFAGALGEGELPGEEPDGVGTEPRMPDELVRELGEGTRGRVKVPVDHGGVLVHEWFRPPADGCNRHWGLFCVNVQHSLCLGRRVK